MRNFKLTPRATIFVGPCKLYHYRQEASGRAIDVAALFNRDARNRIRQLLKLGTDKRSAILAGLSRKGYWRLSRTLSTHTRDANAWLAEQGVLSLQELWVNKPDQRFLEPFPC